MNKEDIMVILPAYNEEGKIGSMVEESKKYSCEVVVVNDCSTDKTAEEAKLAGATVITHKNNKGVGAGIKTGLQYAIKRSYGVIIVMGADKQDDPNEIPKFIKAIKNGSEFVQGSRYLHEDSANYPKFRLITTKMYTKFIGFYTWKKITDASNGYRAFTRGFVKSLDLTLDGMDRYEFETYYLLHALRYAKYSEVPVKKYYPRRIGYSKMKPFISWYQMFKPIATDLFVFKRKA